MQVVDEHFLKMAENTESNDEPSKSFIRKCYEDLITVFMNKNIKLCISGTPGIRNRYYILYHPAKSHQTVIYDDYISEMMDHQILQSGGRFDFRSLEPDIGLFTTSAIETNVDAKYYPETILVKERREESPGSGNKEKNVKSDFEE
ncbi:hypothetical protein RCL_jg7915.t1 [Rhizophagus clarus]|uniref:Uncharacterized protein n=1 Tax=Rhizophagus clarus TaxID=94130 RepID=A0A8H3R5T9_9GLOM|nr:hypothetical protein RCL_jg7915.t1 [Rhizophagus clarus]